MRYALRSIAAGLGRTIRAPRLLLCLWLVNVLAALPAALVMSSILEDSIGPSLFHETLAKGFDGDWYAEFSAENEGLAQTFGPQVLGAGAVYENLEGWWSGRMFTDFPLALVALGVAYAAVWALLLGGVLDALSRSGLGAGGRSRGLAGFLAAGARTFGRFLVLAAAAGVVYYLIYLLARKLFGWLEESTREITVERAVLLRVLVVAAVAVALLHLVRMILDYAKIAVFADDVSVPRALGRGLAFVASRPLPAVAVYGGFGVVAVALIAVYAWLAPGAGQATAVTVILALIGSQLYLAARLAVRLSLLAAELHLYRSP